MVPPVQGSMVPEVVGVTVPLTSQEPESPFEKEMSPKPGGIGSPQFKVTLVGVLAQTGLGIGDTVMVAVSGAKVPQEGLGVHV